MSDVGAATEPSTRPGLADAARLRAVFATVFVVAACGLGYELAAGTIASYLLGDTVVQFSTAIGVYLFALGVGAWASKFIEKRLVERFVDVEIAVALLGGTLACQLFLAFPRGGWFRPVLYGETFAVGTLVGLEIPLLLRILKEDMPFKDLVSKVLTFDYVGALAVALLFPLLLVPRLGHVRTCVAFGLANVFVALWSTYLFEARIERPRPLRVRCAAVIAILAAAAAYGDRVTSWVEETMFGEPIVFAKSTPYQRIVITRGDRSVSLWLNGALQFDGTDEYRYHEALVHPAMASIGEPRRVLVLGGGDGLALREVLRHAAVERATLVDIDPDMTALARDSATLRDLNRRSLSDPRVTVVNDDAMAWLESTRELHDVVIVDFPDPATFAVGKLYTSKFYERLLGRLAPDGVVGVQATSILHTPSAFWCIAKTMEAAGFSVRPYRAFVPSFRGDWGFLLASRRTLDVPDRVPPDLRSLDPTAMRAMFALPPDLPRRQVEVNRLDNQILVRYYEQEEWRPHGG